MNRKAVTANLRAAIEGLLCDGWTEQDVLGYIEKVLPKLRAEADARLAEEAARAEKYRPFEEQRRQRREDMERRHPRPIAGTYFTVYLHTVLEVEVTVGPRGGLRGVLISPGKNGPIRTPVTIKRDRDHGYWVAGSDPLYGSRAEAERIASQSILDRIIRPGQPTGLDLPSDETALRRIVRANHPDKNPDADTALYQRAVERLTALRGR